MSDSDTGLTYMQARYYDPVAGQFLSVDPVTFSPDKPQHFNRYWYANGNPYLYTDPDGRCPNCLSAAIGGAIGFVAGVAMNATVQYSTTGSIDASDALMAGASEGVAGAAIGFNPALAANPAAVAAITGSANVAGSVAADLANGESVDATKAVISGIAGVVAGPLGSKGGEVVEGLLGSGGTVAGQVAGAATSEGVAAGLTVGTNAAVNATQNVIDSVSTAVQQGVSELDAASEKVFLRGFEENK